MRSACPFCCFLRVGGCRRVSNYVHSVCVCTSAHTLVFISARVPRRRSAAKNIWPATVTSHAHSAWRRYAQHKHTQHTQAHTENDNATLWIQIDDGVCGFCNFDMCVPARSAKLCGVVGLVSQQTAVMIYFAKLKRTQFIYQSVCVGAVIYD